jgi:2-amino-4-hydroxy-6-hydroxymethyldihydropteridine diphosphokinase
MEFMNEHTAYIGLGSNLGDKTWNLQNAISEIRASADTLAIEFSSFYNTKPLGRTNQPVFLNAVVKLKTSLTYRSLFEQILKIEQTLGRQRSEHWGPRTIDLDLLLYDDVVITEPDLTVPHPQLHLRSFVLKGMCELDASKNHPLLGRSMKSLYGRLHGKDFHLDGNNPQLVSIAGNIGVGKTTLAGELADRLNAKFIPEKYDDNPFLPKVYAGDMELALDSELFFLSNSVSQLRSDRLFPLHRYVSDYVFDKALIYASSWLGESDLVVYQKHYAAVNEGVALPVLVIYMQDSVENCMERIHKRNRPYEQQIEMPFLEHLAHGYDTLYTDYAVCPVFRITPDQCRTAEQVDQIAKEISYYLAEEAE